MRGRRKVGAWGEGNAKVDTRLSGTLWESSSPRAPPTHLSPPRDGLLHTFDPVTAANGGFLDFGGEGKGGHERKAGECGV